MRLYANQLPQLLSKALPAVICVAGDEPLLVQEALDQIRAAAKTQNFAEREIHDIDRGFDWNTLSDACSTGSLFSDKRIIELRISVAPDKSGTEFISDFITNPPPDILLLISAGALDSRQRSAKWFKSCEAGAPTLYCWPIKSDEQENWIRERARLKNVNLDSTAQTQLANRTEGNLLACAQDIDKLALLRPGETITAEMLDEAVTDNSRFDAFSAFNKILEGDALAAIHSLQRLREENDALPKIMPAIVMSVKSWRDAAQAYARSGNAENACREARVFAANKNAMCRALTRVPLQEIVEWTPKLAEIDRMSKSGLADLAWNAFFSWALLASYGPNHPKSALIPQ